MEDEPPVVGMEGPIDDLPDGIMNDPLEGCPSAAHLDESAPTTIDKDSNNDSENRLLLPDEQKMEDIEKPHHNDGKDERSESSCKKRR
jgi:hypothetical protein